MADHETGARRMSADDFAAVVANRVALFYKRAAAAERALRHIEAAGERVSPEHRAEVIRANAAAIVRVSEAAERESEHITWLLDSGSCSEDMQNTLTNALQSLDDMLSWYGDAMQAVHDLEQGQ